MLHDPVVCEVAGEKLVLYADRALFWERTSTLIIADPHFGKDCAFRAAGIIVPPGTTEADLGRLNRLLAQSGAKRLLVLGDYFHAASGRSATTIDALDRWRKEHTDLTVVLVRGNHDQHAGDPPEEWRYEVVPENLVVPPFLFCHDSTSVGRMSQKCVSSEAVYTLSGHVHPAVRLKDGVRAIKLPCFLFGKTAGLLPAFGGFTGTFVVRPHAGDQVFVVGPEEVVEVSTRAA